VLPGILDCGCPSEVRSVRLLVGGMTVLNEVMH